MTATWESGPIQEPKSEDGIGNVECCLVQSVGVELVASFTTQSFAIGYQTSRMSACKVSRVHRRLWDTRWLGQSGHDVCGCRCRL